MSLKSILLTLLCLAGWGRVFAQLPELSGHIVSVSTSEATSIVTGQWYVMKNRGRTAHVYETTNAALLMSNTDLHDGTASEVCGHLVRFVSVGSADQYYIQTGYGHYFDELINGKGSGAGGGNRGAGTEAKEAYTCSVIAGTAGHYSFTDANGVVMDANPAGSSMAGWGTTLPTSTGGNNDWALYAVTLVKDESGQVTIVPDATDVTAIVSGNNYYIRNVRSGKYLTLQTSYNEGPVVNATPLADVPMSFTLTASGSTYSLKSGAAYVGLSTSIGWNTKNYATEQSVWTIESAEQPDQYYFKNSQGYLKFDGTHDYAYTNGNKTTDASVWALTNAPQNVGTFTEGKYYRLRNYMDESRFITSNNGAIYAYPVTDERYDQIWQATQNGGNWQLMCVLDGQSIRDTRKAQAYATGSSGSPLVVTAKGTATDGRPYVMISPASNTSGYFNNSKANQSYQVVPWSDTNDNSSWWYIEQTPLSVADVEAILQLRTEKANAADILAHAQSYAAALGTYFADNACTQLRDAYKNMSDDDLLAAIGDNLPSELSIMAVNVKNDAWDDDATMNHYVKGFRIADYDVYSNPGEWRNITHVGPFGVLTNPTGITVAKNALLYVMVQNAPRDASATLQLGIAADTEHAPSQTVNLVPGLNIIQTTCAGEAFILYTLNDTSRQLADYPAITIHIEGGTASGCWDMHRGMNNADWEWLSAHLFTAQFLHVKGESTVLNLVTSKVKDATNVEGIMKIWDFVFDTEERLIGHDGQWDGRYRPVINPRDCHASINPNWGGNYGTNHPSITKDYLFNFEKMVNDVGHLWEIYHEEAHAHQYPINIAATTESSNNGYAQMVNYEFGSYNSRNKGIETLLIFKNNGWGWVDILRAGEGTSRTEGFQYYGDALWLQCHLFYQLYLYFHVQGHMPDFWPRVADRMRQNGGITYGRSATAPGYYYNDYLKFAEACADVSQTDLYEFFDTWGFFNYCDEVKVGNDFTNANAQKFKENDRPDLGVRFVGDYGQYYLRMPVRGDAEDEAYLTALKTKMQSMPKKAPGIMFIDDHICQQYVSDTCFIARDDIYPSRRGTAVKYYGVTAGTSGDYGMFTDFDGVNRTSGIDFHVDGNSVSIDGDGLLGIKVYGPDGRLVYLANTQSFTPSDAVRQGILNGTYRLVVVCGDDTEMPILHGDLTDIDGDGQVTIRDVALLVSYLPHSNAYSVESVNAVRDRVLEK